MINLILGGAGFVGSNLIRRILELDQKVVALDNLTLGKIKYLDLDNPRVKFVFASLDDPTCWEHISNQLENEKVFIWHLVANSDIKVGSESPEPDIRNTLNTTLHLLENISSLGEVVGIAFSSTSAIYGEVNAYPNENSYPNPISFYGSAKLSSELFLKNICAQLQIPLWIFRFANVVGAPATHGIIFDLIKKISNDSGHMQILGDGNQQKAYIHVEDLVYAMVYLVQNFSKGGIWNVGPTDNGISVREIVEMICRHFDGIPDPSYGTSDRGWVGDIPRIIIDSSKMNNDLQKKIRSSHNAVHQAIHDIASQFSVEITCDKP